MRVAHLAFDLGPRRERGDRVDHQHVERARADQHVGDFERLLTGVGLRDEQLVGVHADGRGIDRIHRVLGVDVGARAAVALRLGHDVHGERGLTGGLRAEDLDDAAARQAADTQRQVERQRACGDRLDGHVGLVAHAHDRALTELLLDLTECRVECFFALHRSPSFSRVCSDGGHPTEGV